MRRCSWSADRGLGRLQDLMLGSVAAAMGAHAACPVAVVHGAERDAAEAAALPVVVEVDGSAASDAAVAFAFETAAALRASQLAVHSWWEPVFDPALSAMISEWDAIQASEAALLEQRLAAWTAKSTPRCSSNATRSVTVRPAACWSRRRRPTEAVRRNGRMSAVPAADLVAGDVVVVEPGDRIPPTAGC